MARDLSPAETTQMSNSQVLGFITERGGKTSHTAIIAHSLEIPAVVGLDHATLEIQSGDLIILDGITGLVILEPDDWLRRIYQARRADFEIFKSEVVLGSAMPAVTSDGLPTRVMANIEMPEEVSLAFKYGADGVGLYRTEFLYLRQRHLPTEEELFQDYRAGGGGPGPPGGDHPHPGHRRRQVSLAPGVRPGDEPGPGTPGHPLLPEGAKDLPDPAQGHPAGLGLRPGAGHVSPHLQPPGDAGGPADSWSR